MADTLPTQPTDPRWGLSTKGLVALGLAVQVVLLGLGALYYAYGFEDEEHTSLLVATVLTPEDMVYADTELAAKRGTQLPPVDIAQAVVSTPAKVREGERLFVQNCASCHGESGRGDGPSGASLDPPPRDLTGLTGWMRGTSMADIFRTVTLGLPGTQMSAYDYLSHEDRFALTHYVLSLAEGHPQNTPVQLAELDREFSLSEGAREPNVIPLSLAMERLAAEAAQSPAAPDAAGAAALAEAEPRGAALFERITTPEGMAKVGYLLSSDRSWQSSPARLRAIVCAGAPVNGFSAAARQLSSEDWAHVHRYALLRYRAGSAS